MRAQESLGDVARVVDCEHNTAPRADREAYGYSISTREVRDGRIRTSNAKPVDRATFEAWTRRATPHVGDLIFSREAPMGEVGEVPAGTRVCLGQRTVLLRVDRSIADHRFVKYALMEPQAQRWIADHALGSTVLHLNVADVRRIPIAYLPPVDEQRRIVDILDDHLSRLDAADAYLHAAARRSRSLTAVALTRLAQADDARVPLAGLAISSGYGTSTRCVPEGPGLPVVRIPNLRDGRVDLSDEKRAADPTVDLLNLMLTPGDLLIVRTNGSRDLIGRTAVVQPGIEASFASYLIRYRLDPSRVLPDWVHLMLTRPAARRTLEGLAASSAGQYNLSLGKLDGVAIPLPALGEQSFRMAEFRSGSDATESVGQALTAARQRSESLRRLLLAAAFSGGLTGRSSDLDHAEEMAWT